MFRSKSSLFVVVFLVVSLLAACAPAATAPTPAAPATSEQPTVATPAEAWYTAEDLDKSWLHVCTDTPPRQGGGIVIAGAPVAVTGQNWFRQEKAIDTLFSQLLDWTGDTKDVIPDVATEWEISDDGLVYTVHLRDDVLFHDGETLTAEDVKWSYEMTMHPAIGNPSSTVCPMGVIAGAEAFKAGEADEVTGIAVLDDTTIQFTLDQSRADFFDCLMPVNIWPKHLVGDIPFEELIDSEFAIANPVGSGPFKMSEFVPDQYLTLEAFEDYYGGRPYLDTITYRIGLTEESAIVAAIEAGEVHVGTYTGGVTYDRMLNNPDVALVGGYVGGPYTVWPNTDRIDVPMRKALMYAIDLQTIVDSFFPGQGRVFSWDDLDPEHTWVSPDITRYEYDPDKAREILAEIGWDSANDKLVMTSYYKGREQDMLIIETIQQYWADVGINVEVVATDAPAFVARTYEQADFDLAYGGAGPISIVQIADRYVCGRVFPLGYNVSRYCVPEFDELAAAVLIEPDKDTRRELSYAITEQFTEELGLLPLFQLSRVRPVRAEVCSFMHREWTGTAANPDSHPNLWYLAK